jgi:glycosyltransferase involved in cell wall biosynthesis
MNNCGAPADDPLAYLFMVQTGPSYSTTELEPVCRLLSERFSGEIWAYGSYDADMLLGRIRLRVIRERSRYRMVTFVLFARRVLRRALELSRARPRSLVVTSYDPFKGGLLALRVARILGAPFVCEVNGVYGDPSNFSHVRFVLWQRLRLAQMRLLGSFVLRRADAVRILFAEQLRDFVTLPSATVVRCFFALCHTDRFPPGPEEPIILAAGFPFMVKGVDVLVKAFCTIASRFPAWRLVLIGHRIPEQLRARGIKHAQIEVLPGLPQPELACWVSRSAIIVLASRSEGMGRILIEAAAAGKCRVASRVGGIPTVVDDGRDGVLVRKEDAEGLAVALEMLISDPGLRRRLGEAARLRAATEFSPAIYLAHFEELIRATLAKHSPAGRTVT